MHVAKNIFQLTLPTPFSVGDVHVYVLVEETISLIDAGIYTDEAWNSFNEQLSALGLHVDQIDQVVLTHHHPDHTGLLRYFKQNVPIAAHPHVDVWLQRDEAHFVQYIEFFKDAFKKWGVPEEKRTDTSFLKGSLHYAGKGKVTLPLHHLDRLPEHEEWTVLYTLGHAQTHLSLLHEKDNILIGGDHLLQTISSNPLLESPYHGETKRMKPLVQYRESLLELKQRNIKKILPGHGPIITDVDQIIDKRLREFQKRAALVKELLQKEVHTAYALSVKLFPKQTADQLLLTMSQTIGLLDLLEEDGEIHRYEHDEHFVYIPL